MTGQSGGDTAPRAEGTGRDDGATGIVGNAIVGGVIGLAADKASGATLEHTPNPLRVILYPKGKKPADAAPNIVWPQGHAPMAKPGEPVAQPAS